MVGTLHSCTDVCDSSTSSSKPALIQKIVGSTLTNTDSVYLLSTGDVKS